MVFCARRIAAHCALQEDPRARQIFTAGEQRQALTEVDFARVGTSLQDRLQLLDCSLSLSGRRFAASDTELEVKVVWSRGERQFIRLERVLAAARCLVEIATLEGKTGIVFAVLFDHVEFANSFVKPSSLTKRDAFGEMQSDVVGIQGNGAIEMAYGLIKASAADG